LFVGWRRDASVSIEGRGTAEEIKMEYAKIANVKSFQCLLLAQERKQKGHSSARRSFSRKDCPRGNETEFARSNNIASGSVIADVSIGSGSDSDSAATAALPEDLTLSAVKNVLARFRKRF
jgi:hypothetical protein